MAPILQERKAIAPQLEQLKFPCRSSIRDLFCALFWPFLQGQSSAKLLVEDLSGAATLDWEGLGAIVECLPEDKARAATFCTCLAIMLGQLGFSSAAKDVSAPFWMTAKALDMLRVFSVEDIALDTGSIWWNLQAVKIDWNEDNVQ